MEVSGISTKPADTAAELSLESKEQEQVASSPTSSDTLASATKTSAQEKGLFTILSEKITGLCQSVKNAAVRMADTVVYYFNKIFCFWRSEEAVKPATTESESAADTANLIGLTKLKGSFENLLKLFKEELEADTSDDKAVFKAKWQEAFTALSNPEKEMILREDVRSMKKVNILETEEDILAYIDGRLANKTYRDESLQYVRDLVPFEEVGEGKSSDPIGFVPVLLQNVIDGLTKRIEA